MHAEAVRRAAARRPLVVGDRLDTDIEAANRVNTDSLLVLTGVSRPSDVVLAPPHRRPSYLAADLTGLLAPHSVPRGGPREPFSGNGWQARWVSAESTGNGAGQAGSSGAAGASGQATGTPLGARERVELTGSGGRIDALRVLCAAVWPRGPATLEMIADALDAAGLE